MTEKKLPRHRPCASCPYRCEVPSGLWAEEEYEKLPAYDRDTMSQPPHAFMCHQQDGSVCAGWLGYDEPYRLLAVRLGIMFGDLDESCADYTTDVPLFASGTEAAEHGMSGIDEPDERAQVAIDKLIRSRAARES